MLAALVAVGSPASAGAALPDVVAYPPPDRPVVEDLTHNGTFLRALRFNGYIYNHEDAGPLEVRGTNNVGSVMQETAQRKFTSALDYLDAPIVNDLYYDQGDGHNHWHLGAAARYSLRSLNGSALVAPAAKVGFCLTDSAERSSGNGPGPYDTGCGQGQPNIADVVMGLSPGWFDIYGRGLWYQWVDLSNVAPGTYLLRTDVDPDDVIDESDEVNVAAERPVNVPGWKSNPVQSTLPASGPASVTLDADAVPEVRDEGDPYNDGIDTEENPEVPVPALGPPQYRIEQPPAHGTLNRPTGQWLSGAVLSYTPTGDPVADSFTYSVREAGSPFPLSPPRTAVTLSPPAPPDPGQQPPPQQPPPPPPPPPPVVVAISGAPAEMVAGTSVKLTANAPVSWSASAGRITPDGTYTASRTRPSATIRATAAGGAFAETVIRIVAATSQRPLPTACAKGATTVTSPIGRLCARYVGGAVLVSAAPKRAGRLVVKLRRGAKVLKTCGWRAAKGRTYGCRFRTSRRRLSVVVTQQRGGRVLKKRLAVR